MRWSAVNMMRAVLCCGGMVWCSASLHVLNRVGVMLDFAAGCDGAWRQGRPFCHRCRVYHRRALANAAISKLISYKKVCNECIIGLQYRAVAVPKQKDPRLAAEAEQDTGYLTAAAVEYRQRSTFPSAFQAPTSQSDHPASYV